MTIVAVQKNRHRRHCCGRDERTRGRRDKFEPGDCCMAYPDSDCLWQGRLLLLSAVERIVLWHVFCPFGNFCDNFKMRSAHLCHPWFAHSQFAGSCFMLLLILNLRPAATTTHTATAKANVRPSIISPSSKAEAASVKNGCNSWV
jgi:hypothetical protein